MEHDQVAHAGLSRHEASLVGSEVVPFLGLACVLLQVGRFTIEDVRASGQLDDVARTGSRGACAQRIRRWQR